MRHLFQWRVITRLCYLSPWHFRLSLFFTLGLVVIFLVLWVDSTLKYRLRQTQHRIQQQQQSLEQQAQALLLLQTTLLESSVKALYSPTHPDRCSGSFRQIILGEWLEWEQPVTASILWRGEVRITFAQLLDTLETLSACALPLQKMVLQTKNQGIVGQLVIGEPQ